MPNPGQGAKVDKDGHVFKHNSNNGKYSYVENIVRSVRAQPEHPSIKTMMATQTP
jgi:hypothetical protein